MLLGAVAVCAAQPAVKQSSGCDRWPTAACRIVGLPQWQMSAGVGQCGRTHRYEPSLHQIFTEHISKSHGNQRQTMDVKEFFGAMTGAGWLDKK
jgi:hypothetical protein